MQRGPKAVSFEQRFWKYVNKNGPIPAHQPHLGPCWLWTGFLDKNKRGHLRIGPACEGRVEAHRASWIVHHGKPEPGKSVLHHCDNPQCVRPSHLYIGTQKDNIGDMVRRGRQWLQGRGDRFAAEKNPNSKLTWSVVRAIRQDASNGVSGADLGRRYGVTRENIYHIIHRRIWV